MPGLNGPPAGHDPEEGLRARSVRELDCEALATLTTAGREDCTAGPGPHSDEETVSTLAAAVVRLKCTFHLVVPNPLKRKR